MLNSLNLMNRDKTQNWNGYQQYSTIIVMLSDEILKMNFLLIFLDRYLFSVANGNRYLPRVSKENILSATITGNITMSG